MCLDRIKLIHSLHTYYPPTWITNEDYALYQNKLGLVSFRNQQRVTYPNLAYTNVRTSYFVLPFRRPSKGLFKRIGDFTMYCIPVRQNRRPVTIHPDNADLENVGGVLESSSTDSWFWLSDSYRLVSLPLLHPLLSVWLGDFITNFRRMEF